MMVHQVISRVFSIIGLIIPTVWLGSFGHKFTFSQRIWEIPSLMTGDDCYYFLQGNEYLQTVARCLQMMLRIKEYRHTFVELEGVNAYVQSMLFVKACRIISL